MRQPKWGLFGKVLDAGGPFPWYITAPGDRAEMAYFCRDELRTWRRIKARWRAASIESRLLLRGQLAAAFNALRGAYRAIGVKASA